MAGRSVYQGVFLFIDHGSILWVISTILFTHRLYLGHGSDGSIALQLGSSSRKDGKDVVRIHKFELLFARIYAAENTRKEIKCFTFMPAEWKTQG